MRRVVVLLALCGSAAAEVTHVSGTLDGIHARLRVRDQVTIRDELELYTLDVPQHASVVGGTVRAGTQVQVLDLMQSEAARDAFDEVTLRDVGPSPRRGVLIEKVGSEVMVSVAGRRERFTLELDVQAPTCRLGAKRYVEIPTTWVGKLDPELRANVTTSRAVVDHCRPGADTGTFIAFAAPHAEPVQMIAARIVTPQQHVARISLDVTTELGEAPRDLATAIVVDISASMSKDELAVQRAVVAGYLRATPSHRVQVIAFARTARALLPSWTTASQVRAQLDRELAALTTSNGSDIEAALAEAGRWLARVEGTRRVVLVTDERLPRARAARITELRTLLPPRTLVHAVAVEDHRILSRDDTAVLAPLARATGGMVVRTGAPQDQHIDLDLLVRPKTFDALTVNAPGWTESTQSRCAEPIDAGRSCTWLATGDAIAGPIAIEGYVWGTRISRVLRPDPALGARFARDLDAGNPAIEFAKREVNSDWSLFATWGGKDSYSAGILHVGGLLGRTFDPLGASVPLFTPEAAVEVTITKFDLRAQLMGTVRSCVAKGTPVVVEIETTRDEIVDVAVREPADPKLRACLDAALWNARVIVPESHPHTRTLLAFQ